MNNQQIKDIVIESIEILFEKDTFLLENDINERAISHKLAVYLNDKFVGYDVDCEYNGYADSDNGKKYINILRDQASSLGIIRETDTDEFIKRFVYPDIIVHIRGDSNNLLIIEIKKSTSSVDINFDKEKIRRYTSTELGNELNYNTGAFILFHTGTTDTSYMIEWYQHGDLIEI